MRNQRTFQDGVNFYHGYAVNVVRFTSAYDCSVSGRVAAKHWGTITSPSGEVVDMGVNGMTTPQIKKEIQRLSGGGVVYSARVYNRGGVNVVESKELNQLMRARVQLESLGCSTAELDAKIEAKKAEIEANRVRVDNSKEIKRISKDIEKIKKLRDSMIALNVCSAELDAKIAELESQLAALS